MSAWQEPTIEHAPDGETLTCPQCVAAQQSLYAVQLRGHPWRACYDCVFKNPEALRVWIWALEDSRRALRERAERAEAVRALAELSAADQHALLMRERALLNMLSMDLIASTQRFAARSPSEVRAIETSGGYDAVWASVYTMTDRTTVVRSNLRQAAAALAEQLYGPGWVEDMVHWGEVQQYTALDAPPGHNEWSGPETLTIQELEERLSAERDAARDEHQRAVMGRAMLTFLAPTTPERDALLRLVAAAAGGRAPDPVDVEALTSYAERLTEFDAGTREVLNDALVGSGGDAIP